MTKQLDPRARLSRTAQAAILAATQGREDEAITLMRRLERRGTEKADLEVDAVRIAIEADYNFYRYADEVARADEYEYRANKAEKALADIEKALTRQRQGQDQ